jgi:hypothetical protein
MAFCETEKDWTITLTPDGSAESEILSFHVEIDHNGKITGKVFDSDNQVMSDLEGNCVVKPFPGLPEISVMSFVFRARQDNKELAAHLSGIAFHPSSTSSNPDFEGRYILYIPDETTPAPGTGEFQTIPLGDTGDTGTGSGSQT